MASERVQRRIERLLDEADEAVSRYDWEAVRQAARAVLRFDPENSDASAYLAAADQDSAVDGVVAPSPTTAPQEQAGETASHPSSPAGTGVEAERRQLTVMFCDLQGSTALSQQLDPEELRDVIRSYQEVCAEAVGRFDGHLTKYLGDGVLIYFGYPQAHEDDPQRAVRAGLAILEDMGGLNTRLKADRDLELAVRIGVHTGLVVAGEMGGGDTVEALAIVGDTPNIAARLQEAAVPNTVVVSDVTANLVQGFFLWEALGFHELKGVSEPVELFSVLSESGAQTRFDVAASSQLTPLVGREQEVGLLLDRWEQVEEGLGQVVLIRGEAGIGKSRLLQAINDRLAGRPHYRQEYRCSPYHQNSALYPVIDFLERWLEFRREDTSEGRLSKLEEALADYTVPATEAVALLAGLLSVPLYGRYPPLSLSPERERQKTLELLVQLVIETASRQPVLTLFEDLHWADPTTLELLGLLVDQAPTAQILAILTFRPEFTPTWGSRAHLAQITLNRLPQRLATDMMARLTGGKEFPEEVVTQIAAKSDGVPLFVEELTRMVVESDLLREVDGSYELTGPLPPLAIPSTLQDSLTARLDRLSSVRESVQLAAVLGREFSYEMIQAVSPLDDAALARDLGQLVTSEFLYQRGVAPESSYTFKHALIQDAAFNSLLISRRQQYHQHVAQALEERFPETVETQPELVAYQYTEAGFNEQAITYWQQAGQRAMRRSANVEAVNHLTRGLELLETLPDVSERASQELALQTMLGQGLIQTRGFTVPEVQLAFARARELIDQVEEISQYFQVMYGLFAYYTVRAEYQSALEVAEQCLEAAQRGQDPFPLLMAHRIIGIAMVSMGEPVSAREHLLQGFSRYEIERHRSLAQTYGLEPRSSGLIWSAINLWLLGYPDEASSHIQEAVTLAQEVSHPFTLAYVEFFAAAYHVRSRAIQPALRYIEAVLDLAQEQGFAVWLTGAQNFQGACWVQMGRIEEGIANIRQGTATFAVVGVRNGLTEVQAWLAKAHLIAGRAQDGLTELSEAFANLEETGERFWEAELYRIKAELLRLQDESEDEAEECLHQALEVSKSQSAKSLELRAAMSLARLWQKQGKAPEALELLSGIYGWFTEGFDTPDLVDAKALLEELSQ